MTRVVVTGMGVVAPIGVGLEAFAAALRAGTSGTSIAQHWPSATFPNRLAAEVADDMLAPALMPLGALDAAWLAADRKALLGAAAVAMAIADAQLGPGPDRFRRAVCLGPGENPDALRAGAARQAGADLAPSGLPFDALARWTAARHGFAGPSASNIGACAAGAMAIGEALGWLRRGKADVVLAGGFDAICSPVGCMGFSILGALSARHDDPTRASRPFDVNRDGFVPGEGAGMLVLETLDHALARGARIYAELSGYGASLDAYRPTAPEPTGRGASLAMRRALADAGWAPTAVGYVNAHGTSTPLNDRTETLAIKQVLGDHAYNIPVSSTKSQIGHLVAGAGAVELIAGILAMHGGFFPPTINHVTPDPDCDLDYVARAARAGHFDRFLSNSFAFGGQNACLAASRFV